MDSINDNENEDFMFNLDGGDGGEPLDVTETEGEADGEAEAVAPTRPVELTSEQKDRAEKNRIKALALRKAKIATPNPQMVISFFNLSFQDLKVYEGQ